MKVKRKSLALGGALSNWQNIVKVLRTHLALISQAVLQVHSGG